MKFENLPESLKSRFDHCYWGIYLYNHSLNELQIISDIPYTQQELEIANSHTFDFYRITLHYCFIMEYNKLFEVGRKDNDQNISSLFQLNEALLKTLGQSFRQSHFRINEKLSTVRNSKFYSKIRDLRDKKYGHSDKHEINKPFSFVGFKTEDFENGLFHLQTIQEIFDLASNPFDLSFDIDIPNREDRTKNFIQFQAKYKAYYFKNFMEAEFGINKKNST